MSLTSPTTIRLMEALLVGPEEPHREALMRQAEVSQASFYRSIEALLEAGLVREKGGRYCLLLSNPHNYAFKLWHDQRRLLDLPVALREEIYGHCARLQEEYKTHLLALWLVGSAAQLSLQEQSDLDLVAVVRQTKDVDLRGSRPVQLTTFLEKSFREGVARGDNFLRSVLTHGLVLYDRGFVQEFYLEPSPGPRAQLVLEREDTLERLSSRFHFFLHEEALEEAYECLNGYAVAMARGMLEPLGELPAGKPDLVEACALYFGPRLEENLRSCLSKAAPRSELTRLLAELQATHQRFQPRAGYLAGLAHSLRGPGAEYEAGCLRMLQAIASDSVLEGIVEDEVEARVQVGDQVLQVAFKTTKSALTPRQLRQFAEQLPSPSPLTPRLLVVNSLRDLPPTKRPPLSPTLCEQAGRLGLILLDSRDLFQFHNRTLLEAPPPSPRDWLRDLLA